jgi:hypothetical protein
MATCAIRPTSPSDWQTGFLALLPAIERYARSQFRRLPAEAREEAVRDAVAHACVDYRRLAQRGALARAWASPLARYAVAQHRAGRRAGTSSASQDVYAPRAPQRAGFTLDRLSDGDQWRDALIDDRRTSVPDQVAFRLDFPRWLLRQSPRNRRLVAQLVGGATTTEAAAACALSPGRVSQLRRELAASWAEFQSDRRTPA